MKTSKAVLALSLVLGVWVASPPGAHACDGVVAHRVKERPAGATQRSRNLIAVGDFDGDGRVDKAFFVESSGAFPLVVCHRGGTQLSTIFDLGEIGSLVNYGIRAIPRGIHPTFCGKGYGPDCGPTEPSEMKLDHEAIEFFDFERFSFLLYWSEGAWKRIPWSD